MHAQVLTRLVVDGSDLETALAAPRWMVSPADWSLLAEDDLGADAVRDLRRRGHRVNTVPPHTPVLGQANCIEVAAGGFVPATDPRSEGAASRV